MAMTKESMASRIETYTAAVSALQTSDPSAAMGNRRAMLEAMCQGIIDEIVAAAVVTVNNVQTGTGAATGQVTS